MNGWGFLLVACVVMAAAKAVAQAIHMGIYLAIVIGALTRPRETFGLLAVWLCAQCIQAQPIVTIIAAALVVSFAAGRQKAN